MNINPAIKQEMHRLPSREYSTACSFLVCAKRTLDAHGLNGIQLLSEGGIPAKDHITSKAMLPIKTIGRSWQIVANTIDDPAIGVRAAIQHFNPVYWQFHFVAVFKGRVSVKANFVFIQLMKMCLVAQK